MIVTYEDDIYNCFIREFVEDHGLSIVPFDVELVDSEYHLMFNVCCGETKVPLVLMFWQNLDRLRHRMEETAYCGAWEWVRIPFSEGNGDPLNHLSLKFFGKGKVAVYLDMETSDSHLFVCREEDIMEKLYTSLLNWTQLYDDSIAGTKHNEYFYSKQLAYDHMKSPILEEYFRDIHESNYLWRHYASEPGKYYEEDYDDCDEI